MTKRPTVGHSFFEFAEFLRNFVGKLISFLCVCVWRWDESLT
jgi:hypothetical protein